MIRIKFELIPAGVGELSRDFASIIIGCKPPFDNPNKQDMFVFSMGFYTELQAYDLERTLYNPPDGKNHLIDICADAIKSLQTSSKPIQRGAIYPGILSVDEGEFKLKIAEITRNFPDVEKIILFGKRAAPVGMVGFLEGNNEILREVGDFQSGKYYLKNYPGYVPWMVGIMLKDGGPRDVERTIARNHSLRKMPHIPELRCRNGILFYFIRPDGRIATLETSRHIERDMPNLKVYPVMQSAPLLAEIKRGRVIYQRENEAATVAP